MDQQTAVKKMFHSTDGCQSNLQADVLHSHVVPVQLDVLGFEQVPLVTEVENQLLAVLGRMLADLVHGDLVQQTGHACAEVAQLVVTAELE